jgi:hypothetical protein
MRWTGWKDQKLKPKMLNHKTLLQGWEINMRRSVPTAYFITNVQLEEDGHTKEYYALHDGQGNLYSKNDFVELIKKVQPFYSLENVEKLIEKDNELGYIETKLMNYSQNYSIEMPEYKDGVFKIPKPRYKFKEFKTDKKNWSCTCAWCGKKVSSKTEKGYYLVSNSIFSVNERACSIDCVNLIWKDIFKNWIHENGYQKYFEPM